MQGCMESILARAGENAKKINVLELVPLLEAAGAAAVTIHGAGPHACLLSSTALPLSLYAV